MKNLRPEELQKVLIKLGACQEARDWCKGKTSAQAWDKCQHGDWMLWVERKLWKFTPTQQAEFEAKLSPINDEYYAKLKPIWDEYYAKRKPIRDEYQVKHADLIRSITPNLVKD